MNVEHDMFIGVYDDVFSPMYCDKLIDYYEWCAKNNKTWNRSEKGYLKKDTSCILNPINHSEITFASQNLCGLIDEFNTGFWNTCYKDYMETYSILESHNNHTIFSYKIQKTLPGEGYHQWHCENGEKVHNNRIAAYILYLNDVPNGGETEFLYCSKRVEPKKGRLVIWPANYPWTHRGNPPLSGEKYIMTGWIEFS
jgi:hypothetical protein